MRLALTAGLALVFSASLLLAHHSFAGEFDDKKPVSLRGALTRIEWENPHVFLYLDVQDENGQVSHWKFETGSPMALAQAGLTREFFRPGDVITVGGFRARDGSNYASGLQVRRLLGGQFNVTEPL